jgi:CubicO group peptidase (beta-lactamase class C family)
MAAILILIGICYNAFSFVSLPESISKSSIRNVEDNRYSEQITGASAYLKTIPEKINVPSFSVAVGLKGSVIWSETIGYQDIKSNIPASPNTIYRIGSTSKAVASTLVAKIFEEGGIDLDYSITDEIENYPSKEWSITPRQLLSHSAGIPDYEDLSIHGLYSTLCNCKNYESVTESLSIFNDVDLQYEPNTNYEYTSMGYILLSAYIEELTNKDFLSLLNEKLFHPLNMTNTFGDHSLKEKRNIATFYETKENKYRKWKTFGFIPNEIDLSYKWAGGGIMSTPTDLVKMGSAILTDSMFLSANTKSIFFEPQILNSGEINPQRYALGWRSYKEYKNDKFDKSIWMVHHGGVSKGSMNFLVLFPEYELVIDASINTRTEDFLIFWEEVMKVASFFLNQEIRN